MPRDRENNNLWHRDYHRRNRDVINSKRRERYIKDPNRSEKEKARYLASKPIVTARLKRYRVKLKQEMVEAYGGKCTCCGEDRIEFLTVEHLNNDGKAHRSSLKTSTAIYRDIKKRGYPSDYTVLCFNCNIAKSLYGSCPHQLAYKAPSPDEKGT